MHYELVSDSRCLRMLYDFHKYQNALRSDSVHATYLVYGTKTSDNAQADGDVEMTSSMPDNDALSEDVATTTLTLAREEELKGNRTLAPVVMTPSLALFDIDQTNPRCLGRLQTGHCYSCLQPGASSPKGSIPSLRCRNATI